MKIWFSSDTNKRIHSYNDILVNVYLFLLFIFN